MENYIRILEAETIKQVETKERIKKEYFRRKRKKLETKLNSRNLIKEINTWAISLVRYSGPFLKCIREELKQIDQRTRKLITIHKSLHPRDDFDRRHVSRKKRGRGLASIEDGVDASIRRLEDYIKKREKRLITSTGNNTENTRINRTEITRKQKREEKQLSGRFKQLTSDVLHEKS